MNKLHVWNRALTGCFSVLCVVAAGISITRADVVKMNSTSYVTLSGFVYCDVNNDGIWQRTEGRIIDVLVTLKGLINPNSAEAKSLGIGLSSLSVLSATRTDSKGFYRFDNVLPGAYSIIEEKLEMFVEGKKNTPISIFGGQATDCNTYENVVVFSGASAQGVSGAGYNFGEWGLKTKYLSKRSLIVVVPEPSTAAILAGLFILGLYWIRRR